MFKFNLKKFLGLEVKPPQPISDLPPGMIKVAIGTHEDRIILNFGNPTSYLSMTREQAVGVADAILQNIPKLTEGKK